jgi:hypothetical protein
MSSTLAHLWQRLWISDICDELAQLQQGGLRLIAWRIEQLFSCMPPLQNPHTWPASSAANTSASTMCFPLAPLMMVAP